MNRIMDRKERVERRKHKRFRAEDGAYAAIRPHYNKIGQIIDVSRGGLAFRYMVCDSENDGSYELDIFLLGNGFHLDKVSVRMVSDQDMPKGVSPGSLNMRRCAVQFEELSQKESLQLDYFMENHTLGEV